MNNFNKNIMLFFIPVFFFLGFASSFAQQPKEVQYYNNGQNGIEFIAQSNKETVIVSNFNAKMTIRNEIARNVYDFYLKNKYLKGGVIIIKGLQAKVTGRFEKIKKDKLTNLNFYYEKVEWTNGLVEIFKK
jgi:hypothetical protein